MAGGESSKTHELEMDDGVHLNVKILGQTPTHKKPLLIALHGAPGLSTLEEPESSFAFLSDIFQVLVYDARGSGKSELIGPYTHDRWLQDLDALRVWAGAEKFVLAGGSYGGFLALEYAIRHGDRLQGLILRGTSAYGVGLTMRSFANILTSPLLKVDVERQLRLWTGNLYDDKDFEEAFDEIIPIYAPPKDSTNAGVDSVEKEFGGAGRNSKKRAAYNSATQNYAFSFNVPHYDVRRRLGEIKVPTLVTVGRYDKLAPVSSAEELGNGIPNSRVEIFEHSGHSPPSDEPKQFREKVSSFVHDSLGHITSSD